MTTPEYQDQHQATTGWPAGLPPNWIEYLASRGVRPDIARQRGYAALLSGRRKANLGGEYATVHGLGSQGGLYIPLRGLLDPEGAACQLRVENPDPGKPKFRTPAGQFNVLATHPATIDLLTASEQSIVIAEGITRVDALAGYGIPAVGLTGGNNWKGGRPSRVLPDFDALGIRGNRFLLAFDGDVTTNRNVHRAAEGLADVLLSKGADAVSVLTLPDGLGLDDWIAREGFADAVALWAALRQHSRAEVGHRPPARVEAKSPAASAGRYDWYAGGDFLPAWDCTPDADIMRTMRRNAADLLVVWPDDGTLPYLRAAVNEVWTKADAAIDQIIADTSLAWATDALADKDVDRNEAAQVVRWQKRLSSTAGRNAAQDSVGRVLLRWRDDGMLPPGLTQCKESELDAERRYLGAPNGVIDLDTGRLITGAQARGLLVSRSVPDPYDPAARHPMIDGLVAHLGDAERQYLLAALGFALRGNPARRFYLLAGERNGGKTTILTAARACLGDVGGVGYGVSVQPAVLVNDKMQYGHGHQGGLFGVQDARIATASELPDGAGKFNVGLMKSLSGGDILRLRDVGEKAGRGRPASATLFVAMNPPDFDRLDLTDSALEDRARILPYPALPAGKGNPAVLDTVQQNRAARQAMLAVLVRAATAFAGNPYPPADIPSVIEAVAERRQASIGEVGQWLRDNLVVTNRGDHRLTTDDLIAALAAEFPPDDRGRYAGNTRKNVLAMARELVPGLPAARLSSTGGAKRRTYQGVRLATAEELQAHFEQYGDDWGMGTSPACQMPDCEEPAGASGFCADCDGLEQRNVRRMGRVAPADAIEALANTTPGELAAIRPLVSPTDAERAKDALGTLTNALGNTAEAVADGATLGAQTPDELVNRAFPQLWGAVAGIAAAQFEPDSDSETPQSEED